MLEPYTPEWHEFRKHNIGGSDATVIMGLSPWRTREELLHEKCGLISPQKENSYMRRGKKMENEALGVFEREKNLTLMTPRVYKHASIPYLFCSVDGVDFEEKIFVEIKCPGKKDHQTALDGKVPDKYIPQLQHTMEVVGASCLYYFSYSNSQSFKSILVERDEDFIKKMLAEEEKFYQELCELKEKLTISCA